MSNLYFQFKKFTIRQDQCSMKVCTDSCLFGAWVALQIENKTINPANILDIGTGTGLLSLMLAQKIDSQIHAIDIESAAYRQAKENFTLSAWQHQIKIFHDDIRHWNSPAFYDLIICNPPFYETDLLPADEAKHVSKHSATLSLQELLQSIKRVLSATGYFAILLPAKRNNEFENRITENLFFIKEKVNVRQTFLHNHFRTMYLIQKNITIQQETELTIKDNGNEYTKEFTALLKDYYLHL